MSYSRWLLILYALWLPATLLAQPGLVTNEVGNQTADVQNGVGVFGSVLGIHGTDTLAMHGDLVLVDAEVVGEGVLSFCARHPQHIFARKSSVQNLHIANPTQVTVVGDLRIRKSLVIEKGVFDSRMATLTLSDTCRVRVGKEGQIQWRESPVLVEQTKTVPQPSPASWLTWATVPHELMLWKRGQLARVIRFPYQPCRWLPKDTIPLSPPPEPGNTSASSGWV